jgi:hypothetical protein
VCILNNVLVVVCFLVILRTSADFSGMSLLLMPLQLYDLLLPYLVNSAGLCSPLLQVDVAAHELNFCFRLSSETPDAAAAGSAGDAAAVPELL